MDDSPSDFDASLDEFLVGTRELIGLESTEDVPPPIPPAEPYRGGSPVPSALVLDEEIVRRYAHSIGDDNPLYTDRAYAEASHWKSLIAPGPILVHARYPADHGASRPNGYPLANFIGGVAWEFFDVVRPGMRIAASKVLREVLEPRGVRGRLFLLVCEVTYFDARDHMIAKAYGTLVQVPMKSMDATRSMPADQIGAELLNERHPHRYTPTEVAEIVRIMDGERRRGAEPRFWEDVTIGDDLPPIAQPPYTIEDALSYQFLHQGLVAGYGNGRLARAFTPAYRMHKLGWGYPDFSRIHPVTRWPHTPGDEHEDPMLCGFRGQPLPFDFGIQRAQIPQRLLGNWAGDSAFCRKMSMVMSRPLFHGDAFILRGRVTGKSIVEESGRMHHRVRVAMVGSNQRGESISRGFATIYLPSKTEGAASVPIQSPAPYVPLDEHRSPSWY